VEYVIFKVRQLLEIKEAYTSVIFMCRIEIYVCVYLDYVCIYEIRVCFLVSYIIKISSP